MPDTYVIFQRVASDGSTDELARYASSATGCVKVEEDKESGNTLVNYFLECPDKPKAAPKKPAAKKAAPKSKAKK